MNADASAVAPAYLGLAPFLRKSIAGGDLVAQARDCLALTQSYPDSADAWMNYAIACFVFGREDTGLAAQQYALTLARCYRLPAQRSPARARVLMLMAPGNLAANTPLECLLENADIELLHYFVGDDVLQFDKLPVHDVVLVAVGAIEHNQALLQKLSRELAQWPRPVLNPPAQINHTRRDIFWRLMQGVPGVVVPPTLTASRQALRSGVEQDGAGVTIDGEFLRYPLIIRPMGEHGGRGLSQIENADALGAYLAASGSDVFYASLFVDYRNAEGLFSKFRLAFVEGRVFVAHMALSEDWVVHYVSAHMYDEPERRDAEARFMQQFAVFSARHAHALREVSERVSLDYFCIDAAETPDGQLLIFEADHAMIVHAMDDETLFPHKQTVMRSLADAVRHWLIERGEACCRAMS